MAGAEGEKRMITLTSSDGDEFEVEEAVAMASPTIRRMIEDNGADNGIPLLNLNGRILCMVIEYCYYKHFRAGDSSSTWPGRAEELKNWDAEFVKVSQATLFDLVMAANYLDIKGLLALACQTVANMIKSKTREEIRKTFNIQNDFTHEEGEALELENQWAFE